MPAPPGYSRPTTGHAANGVIDLRAALKVDGEVVDCDAAMPFRLFRHLWQVGQDRKARKIRRCAADAT